MAEYWDDVTRLAWYNRTVVHNKWIRPPIHAKQRLFLQMGDVREIFYGGSGGGGKALSLDTPVATPDGWSTMGELKAGDTVFGADGKPTRVLYNSGVQLNRKCYKLTFDDGSEIVADAEHLWHTFTAKELSAKNRRSDEWRSRRRSNRPSRVTGNKSAKFTASLTARNATLLRPPCKEVPTGGIRTTDEIIRTLRFREGEKAQANHAIPLAASIECPAIDLPLDPYLLGVWLGDGTSQDGGITSADDEIPEAFREAGFEVNKSKANYRWGTIGVSPILRKMGLLSNKHVPAMYLRTSREQRLALVQGLMDTGGTVDKCGRISFDNTNRRLADAMFELVASLGYKPHFREGVAKLNGRTIGPKYTVGWTTSEPMFRLKRKLERQGRRTQQRVTTRYRYIVACEPTESVPVCCIKVDNADSMFLCGRAMIPTHNSHALWFAALQYVDVPGYAALILRRSYADLSKPGALMDRSKEYLAKVNLTLPENERAVWNETKKQWTFPSGATISFGHMESENTKYDYASAEYQYIAFDELTHFDETMYTFLFTRLRKKKEGPLAAVPLRMRSASNPGARGHAWVKKRFVDPKTRKPEALFISASMHDNPSLDLKEYESSLENVDAITREQIKKGNWDAIDGGMFRREWFRYYRRERDQVVLLSPQREEIERFNPWHRPRWQSYDPSSSGSPGADDYVASTWGLSLRANLVWLNCHIQKQDIPEQLERVKQIYRRWSPQFITVEEVLNQRSQAQLLRRCTDPVMVVRGVSPLGKNKKERAAPSTVLMSDGRIFLPEDDRSFPLEDVESELLRFTGEDGNQDNAADSLFYGVEAMRWVSAYSGPPGAKMTPTFHDPAAPLSPHHLLQQQQHRSGGGMTPGVSQYRPKR